MKTRPNFPKFIVLVAATCLIAVGQAFCQGSGSASSQPVGTVSSYNGLTLEPIEKNSGFTFFMAGHLFGSSRSAKKTTDPSPLLAAQIDRINNSQAKFFMGLGDLYWRQDDDRAKNFKSEIAGKINIPFFNAVGNHDLMNDGKSDRAAYEALFGSQSYYSFDYGVGSFIVLDSELDASIIEGDQLDFLKKALDSAKNRKETKLLFIFSHRLAWVVNNPAYKAAETYSNSQVDSNNFVQDIVPLLQDVAETKPIFWASGDLGVHKPFTVYYQKETGFDIAYVACGFGAAKEDVLLRVDVKGSGEYNFVPVPLDEDWAPKAASHYGNDFLKEQFGG